MITLNIMAIMVGIMMMFSPYREDSFVGKVIVTLALLNILLYTYIEVIG